MSDIEKRYIERVTQTILNNFSSQNHFFQLNDILQKIFEEEIKTFDIGFYFLLDHINNNFKFGGLFPENYSYIKNEIVERFMANNHALSIDAPLFEKCGLFYYLAKNFITNCSDNEIYIVINDFKKFINKKEISKYNIDIDSLKNSIKAQYIFPIYLKNDQKQQFNSDKILHAIVVFVSFRKKNKIREHDLKLLSDLISFILSVEARKVANKAFNCFINTLSNFDKVTYSYEEYNKIVNALKEFYVSNEDQNTLKQSRLKHASLWTLNNTNPKNIFLVKEKNFDFPNINNNIANIITNDFIKDSNKRHYFYQYIISQLNKIKKVNNKVYFENLIEIVKFKDICQQFYKKDDFIKSYCIEDEDIVVLFPIIPHINIGENEIKNIGMMVLYFAKNTCAYYFNPNYLELMSHKIYENMQIVISKTRREIRNRIFKDISSIAKRDDVFYETASIAIRSVLNSEYCLIYLFNEERTKLKLIPRKSLDYFPEEFDFKNEKVICELNKITSNNKSTADFIEYLKHLRQDKHISEHLIWYKKDFKNDHHIYSALLIPIKVAKNPVSGLLVCVNAKRSINKHPITDKSFFSFKDYEIASIGAESIGIYIEILNHAEKYRKLLQKMSHEIPAQVGFVMQISEEVQEKIASIMESMQKILSNENYIKIIDDYNRNKIFNMLKNQFQAAYRIKLFSEYINIERLDKLFVIKGKEIFEINKFFSSIIEGFRLSAEKKGVFIEFNIISNFISYKKLSIDAHPFLKNAIWNIINNAIQYSYLGTTVHIAYEDTTDFHLFHIENIGISIPEEIKELIYEENYRGFEAKKRYSQGTGFGLSFAKKVVEAHGGEIEIDNSNDFCRHNIFGMYELSKFLERFSSDFEREKFLNQKRRQHYKYEIFKQKILISVAEDKILNKYRKYLISSSDRSEPDIVLNYINSVFEQNDNIDVIFKSDIDVSTSHIKFTLKIPKILRIQ